MTKSLSDLRTYAQEKHDQAERNDNECLCHLDIGHLADIVLGLLDRIEETTALPRADVARLVDPEKQPYIDAYGWCVHCDTLKGKGHSETCPVRRIQEALAVQDESPNEPPLKTPSSP